MPVEQRGQPLKSSSSLFASGGSSRRRRSVQCLKDTRPGARPSSAFALVTPLVTFPPQRSNVFLAAAADDSESLELLLLP